MSQDEVEQCKPPSKPIQVKQAEDEFIDHLDSMYVPSKKDSIKLAKIGQRQSHQISKRMEKLCVAPGEMGSFMNWGDDIFLEEKTFPDKFPYGYGGYLSTCLKENKYDKLSKL